MRSVATEGGRVKTNKANSLPLRLQWYLSRRKDVAEHEKAGVCKTLNALEASLRPTPQISDRGE